MSYREGGGLDTDHILTDRGEFGAIARDFGMGAALTCWVNTHPVAATLAGGAAGIAVALAAACALLSLA